MAEYNKSAVTIAGPTACGKTAAAVAFAELAGGEVVCADSMQIYDRLRVGTARPLESEMRGIRHHLFGCVDPSVSYSLARYCDDARRAMEDISSRGSLPLLCGGTGLYVSALCEGVELVQDAGNSDLRERLCERLEAEGPESLLGELRSRDPEAAALVHPNNKKRLVRYLELYLQTGLTMGERIRRSRQRGGEYDFFIAVLMPGDRALLRERISERVDKMARTGLVDEARLVYDNRESWSTAAQAIGYKELFDYFEGKQTLDSCLDRLKTATARYSKRQITWFKKLEGARFYDVEGFADAEAAAKRIYADFAAWENGAG